MKHLIPFLLLPAAAMADPAEIVDAKAQAAGDSWTVSVTLRHGDTGWDDYADGWRVELADGTVLATRVLVHPHVNEQPFTRSQSGITIPADVDQVMIRASTLTDGWGDETVPLVLP